MVYYYRSKECEENIMEEKKELNPVVQEEEKRLTLNKWVQGIVHYKWWVIGATLTSGVAGALGTQFGLNSITEKLTAGYTYNLATITDEDNVERFVDGTLFNYASVVSKGNMESIKASNEQFNKIDINKIVNNSAISVVRNVDYKTDSSNNVVPESRTVSYTITAKAKFFPSKEVGKEFIEALILSPKTSSSLAIARYSVTSYVSTNFSELSYSEKVGALQSQQRVIASTYENLEDKFGGYVIGNANGQTLAQISSDFNSVASKVSVLANAFYANGYVDYVSGQESQRILEIKAEAEANVKALESKQNELDVAKDLLKTMQSATVISTLQSESEYSKELIKLKNQITALSNEIDSMVKDLHWAGYYPNSEGVWEFNDFDEHNACYQLTNLDATWVSKNAAYGEELAAAASSLIVERSKATDSFKYMYDRYNNGVSILNSGYVEVKSSISWVIGFAVGLILGFLVTSFITGEIEVNGKKKEKESK